MTNVDVAKEIKTAVEAGKIVLGKDVTTKKLKDGKLKAVIVASNCPEEWVVEFESSDKKVEVHKYTGNGLDLGAVCKKPFAVTIAGILG